MRDLWTPLGRGFVGQLLADHMGHFKRGGAEQVSRPNLRPPPFFFGFELRKTLFAACSRCIQEHSSSIGSRNSQNSKSYDHPTRHGRFRTTELVKSRKFPKNWCQKLAFWACQWTVSGVLLRTGGSEWAQTSVKSTATMSSVS